MPGYPGASRAFAIRKLLIAAACDTRIRVSQAERKAENYGMANFFPFDYRYMTLSLCVLRARFREI
jgi:hypothetical protein